MTATGLGTYAFDGLNQMTSATVGATTSGVSHDAFSRLYQIASSAVNTRFLYDGVRPIAEYDAGGMITRRYVPGGRVDETVVEYAGSGLSNRSWLLHDERG